MENVATSDSIEIIRDHLHALEGVREDYDPLLDLIGDARFVLLGEASHGTHEFFRERAQITKRLIREKGFSAVAVEADWPDAYRVHRFVTGQKGDSDAEESLGDFKRFPTWMWRNADVLDFVGWLREFNDLNGESSHKVGFYGMDLYSLHSSVEAVLAYLKKIDPDEARRARSRYSCFEHFGEDPQAYAFAATSAQEHSCEEEVIRQLVELRRRSGDYLERAVAQSARDEFFFAEQNARLVKNAEQYYRSMFYGRQSSWNLRDRHMADTLGALLGHLGKVQANPKLIVWAHNSHLGDARATQMGQRGELNVGQLVRETYGAESRLIGFSTYTGSVTAATEWDMPAERKQVRPALLESYEALFHELGAGRFYLDLNRAPEVMQALVQPRLERAIGVIYLPETERMSHYFEARLSEQFDAILHFDHTRAVEPLERTVEWKAGDIPETFPFSV